MSDVGQREIQQADSPSGETEAQREEALTDEIGPIEAVASNGEMEPRKISGLGEVLRRHREDRGLSRGQMAQMIRLRRHLLEALENEEWQKLPPSVFVKGFIRSYAKALDLDEKRLLELYESTAPVEPPPPRPILETKKSRKGAIVLIVVAGAIALAVYMWYAKPSRERAPIEVQTRGLLESQDFSSEALQPPLLVNKEPEAVKKEVLELESAETDRSAPEPAESESAVFPEDEHQIPEAAPGPVTATEWLILKGIVKSRTWIRIYIDDQEPKEYIFLPGSRPQWKAKEGFYILVGNAAGIDFDFNGEMLENLGKLGEVIRLKLPEDFEIAIDEG